MSVERTTEHPNPVRITHTPRFVGDNCEPAVAGQLGCYRELLIRTLRGCVDLEGLIGGGLNLLGGVAKRAPSRVRYCRCSPTPNARSCG